MARAVDCTCVRSINACYVEPSTECKHLFHIKLSYEFEEKAAYFLERRVGSLGRALQTQATVNLTVSYGLAAYTYLRMHVAITLRFSYIRRSMHA